MPALNGFLWLLMCWLAGELIVHFTGMPISSGVIGMLLLCIALVLRGGVPDSLAAAAQPLIALLAMLIMPGVTGVFFMIDQLAGQWTAIMSGLIVGTLLSVITTLWLLKRLMQDDHAE
jgi:putative effector of murein hydrolase LrgA (UPF0299 family)